MMEQATLFSFDKPDISTEELLMRRRGQFLIHSFIYYTLNDAVISDQKYDEICRELAELQTEYPELSKRLPYYDICSRVDESGSGFFINSYPPQIMATACRILAKERKVPFEEVLARIGLCVVTCITWNLS